MMENELKRIADALEVIAKWDQMQIDRLTEQRTKINVVPIADQVVVPEKKEPTVAVEIPEKPKKKVEKPIEKAEIEMTSDVPWDEGEHEDIEIERSKGIKKKKVEPIITEPAPEEPKPVKVKAKKKEEPVVDAVDADATEMPEEEEAKPAKVEKPKKPATKKPKVIIEEEDDSLDDFF